MKILKEFKEFAMKGNIIDLAVGVVIGGAFQSIVKSLVNDIIMPFTAAFTGDINYTDWVWNLGDIQIGIGSFVTEIINFLIVAFSIFIVIKYINKLNRKLEDVEKQLRGKKGEEEAEAEPETKICPYCLTEIKYKATKCPHCTSDLEKEKVSE